MNDSEEIIYILENYKGIVLVGHTLHQTILHSTNVRAILYTSRN